MSDYNILNLVENYPSLFARKLLKHKVLLVNPSEHLPLLETHGKARDLTDETSSLQIFFFVSVLCAKTLATIALMIA